MERTIPKEWVNTVSLNEWQALCGAVLVTAAVLGLMVRGLRRMWRLASKVNRWLDQVLGEPADGDKPARPGLMDRVASIEAAQREQNTRLTGIEATQREQGATLADHVEWHGDPGGGPADRDGPMGANGGTARRRRRM